MNETLNESIEVSQPDILPSEEFEKATSIDEEQSDVGSSEVDSINSSESEEPEEEKPSSTVIQVIEGDNGEDYEVKELDVESLNLMSGAFVDELKTINQGTNDYYDFIPSDVREYFSGIMANKPLNEYKACHLRHWIQNTNYYSYYDDYYYLWYDLEHNNNYIELVKYNGSSNYVVNYSSGAVLNATILYGSGDNMSDLRRGVSYVQEMAFLSVLGCVCVLYIVHAVFRHLKG